jgi:ubiquitin C-terminal hydrolase
MIKHGFSYEGARALFEYYEEFEEDIPFDPVAIRCDFTEYENFEAVQKDYKDIETLDQLRGNTIVYEVPNTKKLVNELLKTHQPRSANRGAGISFF